MTGKKGKINYLAGCLTLVANVIVAIFTDRLSSWGNSMIDKIVSPFWQDTVGFFVTHISAILIAWLVFTYLGILLYNFLNLSNKPLLGKPLPPSKFVKILYIGFFVLVFVVSLIGGYMIWRNDERADDLTETPTTPENCKIDDCVTSNYKLPCWFTITDNANSSINITKEFKLNQTHAERIAELNRNEDGLIKEFISGERVIIPHPKENRNVENLLCYLNELPLNVIFTECSENAVYSQYPCIYVIKEEETNYPKLAIDRYGYSNNEVIADLKQANDFEYFVDTQGEGNLRELSSLTRGVIVYIPAPK